MDMNDDLAIYILRSFDDNFLDTPWMLNIRLLRFSPNEDENTLHFMSFLMDVPDCCLEKELKVLSYSGLGAPSISHGGL